MISVASARAGALPERVATAANERIAAGFCPTLVFAVVDGDDSEIAAFGRLDDGRAADGDTVYEIGSITKTFTATLLADAVRSGRLTLDAPVAGLLPDVRIPSRGGKEITLLDLATQYSGLPRLPLNLLPVDAANPYADYDAAKLKAFLADYQLPRDPGASYEYSNLGYGLLGYALAQADRTTYPDLVDRKLLKPLGMAMTGVALTDEMRAHLAPGHDASGKPVKDWDFDVLAGAGGLRSTANDMLRYLKANMQLTPPALAETIATAQQPRRDAPNLGRIGLAWMTSANGVVWHNGGTGGYHSFLGMTADRKRGVVVLTNAAIDIDELGKAVLDDGAQLRTGLKIVTLPDAELDDYVGTYRLREGFLLKVFRKDGGLVTQATGQAVVPIFPSAADSFFAKLVDAGITFTRDAQGAVTGLVLRQNGDHWAPKLSPSEIPPEPQEITPDAAVLSNYVGQYRFDFGAVLDVRLDGNGLKAQLTGQAAFPIFASAPDAFFYKVVEAQLHFEREQGSVVAVVLHQGGRDMRGTRIGSSP
ncbi:Beta-lactamase precursor [Bradyrhizobium sp. STM 3843]|uniref:serine hydrolase n=1 Tax=Bradyrhizobium sp. STM 3843 TaxID=551947 RepID=UPI000240462C|nr:serine hydrolase [Bradyrhizobium sp. STM 3843]CCE07999.1 Beta-lactamase precursor [Bradyrhizobium sp. STM 3843]